MPRRNKPIQHKPYIHTMSCQEKRRYRSEDEAKKVAEIQMLRDMNLELSVYKCPECLGWHLTRRKDQE